MVAVLITVALVGLVAYAWWSALSGLTDQARRQAEVQRLECQAERRIQRVAYQALQDMLDEARRHGGTS